MAFLDFLRKPDARFSVDVPPEMMEGFSGGGSIAPRISRNEALQVPAVLRSRNLIAGTLSRLPAHIRDKEHREATPTTLLDQINPDVPNVVTFAETYEDLLFEAISWWRVLRIGWHGYPDFAEHVSTDRVHVSGYAPSINGNAPVQPPVGPGQVYIDGQPVPDDQVIRFDSPNPPLLRHAARAIRTCLSLDMTAAGYSNTPIPLGYFSPKEGVRVREDDDAIEKMLTTWELARKRKVYGYVGSAYDLKSLQFNAEQIQLADQRQHAVLEIARAAGIDPEDLGVSTTSRTYQNSEQRRQDLLDFTLAPYVAAVEQRLSMTDVTPRGYEVKVNFDAFLRADTKTRYEAHAIALTNEFMTIDEVRELEDRPKLPKPIRPKIIAPPAEQIPANGQEAPGAVARREA